MSDELKENLRIIYHQMENINRDRNYIKESNINSGVEKYNN